MPSRYTAAFFSLGDQPLPASLYSLEREGERVTSGGIGIRTGKKRRGGQVNDGE